MARYNYKCDTCKIRDVESLNLDVAFYVSDEDDPTNSNLIWEERHSMSEQPDILCPCCGKSAERTMWGVNSYFYFRGDCYIDKAGCMRDMNLYKLTNDDPYKHIRPPGEKEELQTRLRNAGKVGYDKNGYKKTKYFS